MSPAAEPQPRIRQIRVALAAVWLLTKYWWLARRASSPASFAARLGDPHSESVPATMTAAHVIGIVTRVATWHPLRPACLEQALTACHLLVSAGRIASVRLGVDRTAADFRAHAWVESPDLPEVTRGGRFLPLADIRPDIAIQ